MIGLALPLIIATITKDGFHTQLLIIIAYIITVYRQSLSHSLRRFLQGENQCVDFYNHDFAGRRSLGYTGHVPIYSFYGRIENYF